MEAIKGLIIMILTLGFLLLPCVPLILLVIFIETGAPPLLTVLLCIILFGLVFVFCKD